MTNYGDLNGINSVANKNTDHIPPTRKPENPKEQLIFMFSQDHAIKDLEGVRKCMDKGYLVKSVTMAATGVYCYTTIVLEK